MLTDYFKEVITMSTIKKAYKEIVDLLENNRDTKVKHIIDQVIALASAKSSRSEGSSYIKDAEGTPVAIFDYYFKRHMPLVGDKAVEFGAKAKTATGFNTMCKEGVSHWTKQQKEAKNANTALLSKVASGEIAPDAIVALVPITPTLFLLHLTAASEPGSITPRTGISNFSCNASTA